MPARALASQPMSARGGSARGIPPPGGGGASSRPGTPMSNRGGVRTTRTPGGMTPRQLEAGTPTVERAPSPSEYAGNAEAPVAGDCSGPCYPVGTDDAMDRCNWLHQDASQRRHRLDRLRRQVEQDIEDQNTRVQAAPGSARYASCQTRDTERRSSSLGDRLYQDAARLRAKIRAQQTKAAESRRQDELSGATFSPAIGASQRSWRGSGRSALDPEGVKTRQKLEDMRIQKENDALAGCTFRPEIDPKSAWLMNDRIQRLKISGSLYDHLYDDAQRRQERQLEYSRSLPPGVTFRPDIGTDHARPPNDDNKEDFVNRLAYSKSYSERWLSLRNQGQPEAGLSQDARAQPDFRPQTGRGPIIQRNKDGLPTGEYLYEMGREKALQSQGQAVEEAERDRSQSSAPKVGEASRQLFEESKQRKYKDLFEVLTVGDPQQQLHFATLSLMGLDMELTEFLRPMIAYLKETRSYMDFESFSAALDYQRQHSATPTAHLFVRRSNARTSDRYRQEQDSEVLQHTPRTDPNSNRIASRHRPRSATPLHEQLFREKEVWDSKLHEQRMLKEERALQECTFQPNAAGGSSSVERIAWPPSPRSSSSELQPSRSDPLLASRSIRLGNVVLTDPMPAAAATPTECSTPPCNGNPRRMGNPVAQIINSLESARDRAFVEGILQSFGPEALTLDSCKVQIEEAEQAVAQCKTLLATSSQPVESGPAPIPQ